MASLALLYFLLWVGVAVSTPVDLQKRIIYGVPCGQTDRLYHVRLRATDGTFMSLCGGSLISDRWILTAAHCWNNSRTMEADVNIHPDEKNAQPIKIIKHVIREDPKNKEHDIMLVKLEKKPNTIHKIDLPNLSDCKTDIKVDDVFQVAGHGCNAVDSTNHFLNQCSQTLQCAGMTAVNCFGYEKNLKNLSLHAPFENWICANSTQVVAPGDSGGGLVYNNKIYGIVNGGPKDQAFVTPCYFLRVCKYLQSWIEPTIAKDP